MTQNIVQEEESQVSYLEILNRVDHAVWVYDFDNQRVVWGNPSSLEVWGAESVEELVSRDLSCDVTETVSRRLLQYQSDFIENEGVQFKEIWTIYPNGVPQSLNVIYSGILLADGRMGMACEALLASKFDSDAIRSAEALLHTSVAISLYTSDGVPLYKNPAARTIAKGSTGNLKDYFASTQTLQLLNNSDEDEVKTIASVKTADGLRWHDITARRCHDAVSGNTSWLISEVDVSRLKATEERAQFLAEHDVLTGLPNRNCVSVQFQNRIDGVLAAGNRGALIFVDLDKFKDVNDTLGHTAGDNLLVEVAKRFSQIVRGKDMVARLGGDEFLLLISPSNNAEIEFEKVAERIKSEVIKPIFLQGREIQVTPSIGISLFPENGRDINDLLRHADLAMYHAKDMGRNTHAYFTNDLSDAVSTRLNLESELNTALKEGEFVAYFQPRVDIQSNKITGAEALARWIHPEKGLVSPNVFIPACEASGLIGELGKEILSQAVVAQRKWAELGFDIRMSVNLSPMQFNEENLVEEIVRVVSEGKGNPAMIELEITESVLLGNDQCTINKLHALVECGFRIAIDDFGTGYSNLAYLHRYPIRCLKIDRSFIQDIDVALPIIELILSMARLFKLDVVAEGIETQDQLRELKKLSCHEYQGFLFERPIEYAAFFDLLAQNHHKMAA